MRIQCRKQHGNLEDLLEACARMRILFSNYNAEFITDSCGNAQMVSCTSCTSYRNGFIHTGIHHEKREKLQDVHGSALAISAHFS